MSDWQDQQKTGKNSYGIKYAVSPRGTKIFGYHGCKQLTDTKRADNNPKNPFKPFSIARKMSHYGQYATGYDNYEVKQVNSPKSL